MRLIAVRPRTEDRCTCPGYATIPTASYCTRMLLMPVGYYLRRVLPFLSQSLEYSSSSIYQSAREWL